MKFKALIDFKSREFAGSQYVDGGIYTIRPGNDKLLFMAQRWLTAKRFKPAQDFEVMGIQFRAGVESYVLPGDDLMMIIEDKAAAGAVEWTGEGIITFDVEITGGTVTGGAIKQSIGGLGG